MVGLVSSLVVAPNLPKVAPGLPELRAIKKVKKLYLIWLSSFDTLSLTHRPLLVDLKSCLASLDSALLKR